MDLGLTGKKAVIAGGSRGIGKAIATELAREGADCIIASRSKESLAASAADIARETNNEVKTIAFDATDRASVDAMIEEAAGTLGGLNILVNSASLPGGSPTAVGPIAGLIDEELLDDFNTKYVGALRCCRAALPHMQKAGWGRIINISGGNARSPGNLSGGARNVSLVHLTRTLALQFGRDGITVNCIHPGNTRTEGTPAALEKQAKKLGITPEEVLERRYAPNSPNTNALGRIIEAQEVAYAAVLLASEQARAVTGEVVCANGGAINAVFY
jgi:NAD(P)-dependent dehydrogenase (short-subunit alcohol dehydrogenase family)